MGPTPGNSHDEHPDLAIDSIFRALADTHRRSILEYLAEYPGKTVDCDEVVEYVARNESADIDYSSPDLI